MINLERLPNVVSVTLDTEYVKNTGNYPKELIETTEKLASNAVSVVEKFYKLQFEATIPIFITDRRGIDTAAKEHSTQRWVVGLTSDNGIYLLDPRLYPNLAATYGLESQTDHFFSEEVFEQLIRHEIGHKAFLQRGNVPFRYSDYFRWFNEGIQGYMAGQHRKNLELKPDLEVIQDRTVKGYNAHCTKIIVKLEELQGKDRIQEGTLYILDSLKNKMEILKDEEFEVKKSEINNTFDQSFEHAFGIKPKKEALEKLFQQ